MELNGNFNEDFPVLSTIFMNNKNPKPSLFPQNHTSSHLLIHPNLCNVEGSSSNPFLTMSPQNISSFNSFSAQSNTGFPLPNQNLSHDAYGYSQNSSPYTLPMDMPPPTMDFHAHIGPLSAAVEQEPVIPTNALTERTVETKPRRDRSRMKETRSAGNSTSTREQWSAQEDRCLADFVHQFGEHRWSEIAKMLPKRGGKQCRERWHNHLRPNIRREEWIEEEDLLLVAAHKAVGNKWAKIAKEYLPWRTENSIKNHWNATKRSQMARLARPFGRHNHGKTATERPYSHLQDYIMSLTAETPQEESAAVVFNDDNAANPVVVDKGKMISSSSEEEWEGVELIEAWMGNDSQGSESSSMDMEMEALLNFDVNKEMMGLTEIFPSEDGF